MQSTNSVHMLPFLLQRIYANQIFFLEQGHIHYFKKAQEASNMLFEILDEVINPIPLMAPQHPLDDELDEMLGDSLKQSEETLRGAVQFKSKEHKEALLANIEYLLYKITRDIKARRNLKNSETRKSRGRQGTLNNFVSRRRNRSRSANTRIFDENENE